MSGPKLSAYELEQQRKAELERIQREIIKYRALATKDIIEAQEGQAWCLGEIATLNQQQKYLESSSLGREEKRQISKVIYERIARVTALKEYYGSQKKQIGESDLNEIRAEQQSISTHAEKCRKERAVYEADCEEYEASIASVADNLLTSFQIESYSLEQALSDIQASLPKVSNELTKDKEELLRHAEGILRHPFASSEDKSRAKTAIRRINQVDNSKELHDLRSLVILEIERSLKQRSELNEKYLQRVATYNAIVLSLGAGEQIVPSKCSDTEELKQRIAAIELQSKRLETDLMNKAEQKEIARCIDEAMKELGYSMIGEKCGGESAFQTRLFKFSDEAGLQVNQQRNGVIRIQVVGLANEPKTPNDEERDDLYREQETFCEKYDEILKALKRKGVIMSPGTQKKLPPNRQFSQYVDVRQYNPNYSVQERRDRGNRLRKEPKILSKL